MTKKKKKRRTQEKKGIKGLLRVSRESIKTTFLPLLPPTHSFRVREFKGSSQNSSFLITLTPEISQQFLFSSSLFRLPRLDASPPLSLLLNLRKVAKKCL
jgi:hypothetical protein